MGGIGREYIVIGILHRIYLVDVLLVGQFVVNDHDGGCAVLMQLVQLFGRNDAGAIYFREFPFQKADVVGGGKQAAQVGLIVCLQLGEHTFLNAFVQLEIRLEGGEDTILLAFHHFIGLIDGEVEGGHELSVLPGLVNVELVVEFTVTWQKIDNNPHSADEYQCSV